MLLLILLYLPRCFTNNSYLGETRTSFYEILKQPRTSFNDLPDDFWRQLGGGYSKLMKETGRTVSRKSKGKRDMFEDTDSNTVPDDQEVSL